MDFISRLVPTSVARRELPFPILVAAVAAFLSASCGGPSQRTPLESVPPDVVVDLQDRSYTIRGDDALELRDQMRALGPGSYGRFNWRIDTRWRYGVVEQSSILPGASRETECELKNIDIHLTLTITMPRWERGASAPEELVARWAAFKEGLRVHEEGHRDIALRAAREVRRRLGELRTSNCAFMNREAKELQSSIVDRWQERSREYDEETRSGRTQGAVWPPPRPGG